ncbi:Hypothetical predicted protein, partial [Paramuricea clavata]
MLIQMISYIFTTDYSEQPKNKSIKDECFISGIRRSIPRETVDNSIRIDFQMHQKKLMLRMHRNGHKHFKNYQKIQTKQKHYYDHVKLHIVKVYLHPYTRSKFHRRTHFKHHAIEDWCLTESDFGLRIACSPSEGPAAAFESHDNKFNRYICTFRAIVSSLTSNNSTQCLRTSQVHKGIHV